MTYAIQELVIRDVAPVDPSEITELIADSMWDGPVARWLQPDAAERRARSGDYIQIFVEQAVRCGEVYATADAYTGRLTGAALWFPPTSLIPPPQGDESSTRSRTAAGRLDGERRLKEVTGDAFERACRLDATLDANHPLEPHHYLAFLAVRPECRNRGVGSALLDRHHARLDQAGLPAYLEANHPRNRDLYLRHGYRVRSVIELPDGPPLWTMWRSPMP
jgi:ribosomal protein S18 acetylase RimI-like enzyme